MGNRTTRVFHFAIILCMFLIGCERSKVAINQTESIMPEIYGGNPGNSEIINTTTITIVPSVLNDRKVKKVSHDFNNDTIHYKKDYLAFTTGIINFKIESPMSKEITKVELILVDDTNSGIIVLSKVKSRFYKMLISLKNNEVVWCFPAESVSDSFVPMQSVPAPSKNTDGE